MSKSLPQWTILLVVLACLSLLGLEGWRDWLAHDQQFAATSTSLLNLASSLLQNAEDTVDMADGALTGVVERLQVDGTGPAALTRLGALLRTRTAGLPRLHDFIIFDEHGDWLATSIARLGPNDADREYFRHHRDDPSDSPFIGPAIRSRSTGRWTITVSRRFDHPDGSFGGVAIALIDVDYFVRQFAAVDLGPGQATALLSAAGTLLARNPLDESALNQDFSRGPMLSAMRGRTSGSVNAASTVDGVKRITSFRRSSRFPIAVSASMASSHAFAGWRADTRMHVAIAAILSVVVAALGVYLARQLWRRAAAEAGLRRSEARYRVLAENSGDLITVRSRLTGILAYVSPASRVLLGYEPADFATRPISAYLHPEDRERVASIQQHLTIADPHGNSVHRLRHRAGHWVWVEAVFQLAQPDTAVESVVVTARDITIRRELEAERTIREQELEKSNAELERAARHLVRARDAAEQANLAKSRFLAGMSHELRTPLHGILGYAQLLRAEAPLDALQTVRVDAMLSAGTHLLTMINGVLDLSQIEAERLELQTTETDLRSVAAACLDLVRPAAAAKALAVSLSVQDAVPVRVTTDVTRLRQVLLNLLGNAVKFTSAGSIALRIGVASERRSDSGAAAAGPHLLLEVVDTGRGIPDERRPRLFQDFERLDNAAIGDVEGAGLGLALSHRLAALMGGCLGHEDNPGGGSVFWLELPLVSASPQASPPPAPALPEPVPATPLRVLVVDDVAMNRDIARSFLIAGGHQVVCAAGGAEAVAAAAEADFDVVLMDVRMPEVDGLEATRRIRMLDTERGRVVIVAVTAQAFAEQVEECREAGMDDHLAKPFGAAALLAKVSDAAALAQSRARPDLLARPRAEPQTGLEAATFNQDFFERTAVFLTPAAVASYFTIIVARGEALLQAVQQTDPAPDQVADAAHTLAGSAGMFGCERLAQVAREIETASRDGAGASHELAARLDAAVAATAHALARHAPVAAAAA